MEAGSEGGAASLILARDSLKAWLTRHAYPLWWRAGADHAHGGFHDKLALTGAPVAGPKRARVQARQAICYALAPEFGWTGPSRQAAAHGVDFLISRHRRSDGLYLATVNQAGEAMDDVVDLYDQAFVLFAFAAWCGAAGRGGWFEPGLGTHHRRRTPAPRRRYGRLRRSKAP